jgi:hypothetical protein
VDLEPGQALMPGPAAPATPRHDDDVVPARREGARLKPDLARRPADGGLEIRYGEDHEPPPRTVGSQVSAQPVDIVIRALCDLP